MADLFDERLRKIRVVAIAAATSAVATVVATAYIMLDIPRAPYTNKLAQRIEYMNTILLDDEKCRSNLRMGIDAFNRLCALLKEKDLLKDTKNCQVEEMVMRFLHMLGHHVRHRVLETRFYRSRETISRQFGETLSAILKLYKCLVADHAENVYRGETPLVISSDPRFTPYFKDCVGALDGTHIVATVPEEEQDKFRGRKSYTSQNVLAACSFDLKFTYVLAGWEGSAHDQKVLDDTWTELFKNPISKEKYSKLRDRCIKWDYDQLSIVIGNYHATGSNAMDRLDSVDVTDNYSDLREVEDDTDLDNTERTSIPSKRPLPSLEKRKHGKKTRQVEVVKEMISEMSQKLDSVAQSVHPMSFGRMLQEALRNMTGFSKRYLDVTLGILRKDPVEGELFLLRDEEDRKYMLESMRHQIEDI